MLNKPQVVFKTGAKWLSDSSVGLFPARSDTRATNRPIIIFWGVTASASDALLVSVLRLARANSLKPPPTTMGHLSIGKICKQKSKVLPHDRRVGVLNHSCRRIEKFHVESSPTSLSLRIKQTTVTPRKIRSQHFHLLVNSFCWHKKNQCTPNVMICHQCSVS